MKALIHRRAQFEGDALWNVQPVQFIVEDVRQTAIELPCSSNDSGGGVQDVLQLVSRSSWRVRKQCIAIIYPTGQGKRCSLALSERKLFSTANFNSKEVLVAKLIVNSGRLVD